MSEKLKVIELFAGVGGFRLGLEKSKRYEVVWSNQWEPMTKVQHASMIYENKFGSKGHSNKDIESVPTKTYPIVMFCVLVSHVRLFGGINFKKLKGLIGKKGFCGGRFTEFYLKKS